jgi:MFS family permease
MGSIISTPYFLDAINIKLTDAETISTIVSIYDIGCMIGCLVAAVLGVRLGRKQMIIIGLSIMVVGAIIQASSFSVAQLCVGRIIAVSPSATPSLRIH